MAANTITAEQYADYVARGLIEPFSSPAANGAKAKSIKKIKLAPAVFLAPATWVVPVKLESEANLSHHTGKKMSRNRNVKEAIYRALGPYWKEWGPFGDRVRAGHPCVIRAIRLGGTGLDVANLWSAMKFPEDAIANLLGCSDGMPSWKKSFTVDQEPGEQWGLRVEMRVS